MLLKSWSIFISGKNTHFILTLLNSTASMVGEWIVSMGYFCSHTDRKMQVLVGENCPCNSLSTTHPPMLAYDSKQTSLVRRWLLTAEGKSSERQVHNEQHTCNMLVQLMTVKLHTCSKHVIVRWQYGLDDLELDFWQGQENLSSLQCADWLSGPQ
jgi:hypothetical protein